MCVPTEGKYGDAFAPELTLESLGSKCPTAAGAWAAFVGGDAALHQELTCVTPASRDGDAISLWGQHSLTQSQLKAPKSIWLAKQDQLTDRPLAVWNITTMLHAAAWPQ